MTRQDLEDRIDNLDYIVNRDRLLEEGPAPAFADERIELAILKGFAAGFSEPAAAECYAACDDPNCPYTH